MPSKVRTSFEFSSPQKIDENLKKLDFFSLREEFDKFGIVQALSNGEKKATTLNI